MIIQYLLAMIMMCDVAMSLSYRSKCFAPLLFILRWMTSHICTILSNRINLLGSLQS